jgi:hypothetical protein
MRKLILIAGAVTMLSGTPAFADSSCIRHDDIYNCKSIVLENYRHQKVLLKLIGTCGDFKFHESLAISARGETGLSCVQPGDTIVTRNSGFQGRCAVVSVAPYPVAAPSKPTTN